ncbi:hypothetical protein HUJ05_001513 [Dendroctonus ponderosae]|nr:hypothetical protein HUJ05_001513 [Dendroctonus ponderosae]
MAEETFAALNLDIVQQQSFVRFFRGLPEKGPSTVRFFNRTDYYTLHDDDAKLAADFTSKIIKYMGEAPKLRYVCINKHQMETFIRELLLVRQYRVEVYMKVPGKSNDWQLEYKGSPGNLTQFEQILFENASIETCNSVMGIKFGQNKVYRLKKVDAQRYVRIDNAALYALNILPKPTFNSEGAPVFTQTAKSYSLSGILNRCVTSQGKRLLEQWIKQPQKDFNLINERLDVVGCFVRNSEVRTLITKDALTKIPDLMLISKKLSGKKAKLQDCYRLYQAVNCLPSLINILRKLSNNSVKDMFISPLSEFATDMDKYQTMIETLLDLDLVDRCEFLLKSNVNPEMSELHKLKLNIEEKMQKLLKKAAADLNLEEGKSVKLECNPQHGFFFRITKKEEQVLRQAKQYKIIDAVAGGVRFNNDKLTTLNEDYREINEKYEELQKETLDEMLKVAAGYADTVRNINMILAALDVLASFATAAVSAKIPYVRPVLKPMSERVLNLKKVGVLSIY